MRTFRTPFTIVPAFFAFALFCALLLPCRLEAASSRLDQLLAQQTWKTLQADVKIKLNALDDYTHKNRYCRRSNGDFCLRASAQEYEMLENGHYWVQAPGIRSISGTAAGQNGAFLAMHRLLFAGTDEAQDLEVVSENGDLLELRWIDWPQSPTLAVQLDEHARIASIMTSDGRVKLDRVVYQVTQGKIHPSSWAQQVEGLKGGLQGQGVVQIWYQFSLDNVVMDEVLPGDAFLRPGQ